MNKNKIEEINFQPINDYILVDIVEVDETEGGIILPTDSKERVKYCVITAISDDCILKDKIKVGDKLAFDIYAVNVIEINKKKLMLIRSTAIYGILK